MAMNQGRKISWKGCSDFEEKDHGGPKFTEGAVDEHIGNWQIITDTNSVPRIHFYKMTEDARFEYYLIAQTNISRVRGLNTEEAKLAHASLLCNPVLTRHRNDTAYFEP